MKYLFYAHGGKLNMEDGSFVTSKSLREASYWLNVVPNVVVKGSFKPGKEKDKKTYALSNLE